MQKVSFTYKGKKFSFNAEKCPKPKWGLGLMFKSRNTMPLLFDFEKLSKAALTSLFVFFPFVAVWIDKSGKAVAVERIRPFRLVIGAPGPFIRLLEIPVNEANNKELGVLVGD